MYILVKRNPDEMDTNFLSLLVQNSMKDNLKNDSIETKLIDESAVNCIGRKRTKKTE